MSESERDATMRTSVNPHCYASSVLVCHDVEDDDCPVCRFLSNDKSQIVLLAVIARLDGKLSRVEAMNEKMLNILHSQVSKT